MRPGADRSRGGVCSPAGVLPVVPLQAAWAAIVTELGAVHRLVGGQVAPAAQTQLTLLSIVQLHVERCLLLHVGDLLLLPDFDCILCGVDIQRATPAAPAEVGAAAAAARTAGGARLQEDSLLRRILCETDCK